MFKFMDMNHPSRLSTKFWRMSNVSAHATSCDLSNNPYAEEPDESSPVHFHLPLSSQFEHIENFGKAISSDWTPWVQHTVGYLSGEFVVGQVFSSKYDL